jgi:hypothetical protein
MRGGGGCGAMAAMNLLPPSSPARQYFTLLRLHRLAVWGRGVGVGGALDSPATSLLSQIFNHPPQQSAGAGGCPGSLQHCTQQNFGGGNWQEGRENTISTPLASYSSPPPLHMDAAVLT